MLSGNRGLQVAVAPWNPGPRTFRVSDKGLISSHSALRASRTGLHGKPRASVEVRGGRRLRLGDAPPHSPRTPSSNDMSVRGNHRPRPDRRRGYRSNRNRNGNSGATTSHDLLARRERQNVAGGLMKYSSARAAPPEV